jgi:hypothetical protein
MTTGAITVLAFMGLATAWFMTLDYLTRGWGQHDTV